MAKQPLLQSLRSHDPFKITLMYWFATPTIFPIIMNVENSCAAYYFSRILFGNRIYFTAKKKIFSVFFFFLVFKSYVPVLNQDTVTWIIKWEDIKSHSEKIMFIPNTIQNIFKWGKKNKQFKWKQNYFYYTIDRYFFVLSINSENKT